MGYGHGRLNYPETFADFFHPGEFVAGIAGAGEVTRVWSDSDYYDNTKQFVEFRLADGSLVVHHPASLRKISLLELLALTAR